VIRDPSILEETRGNDDEDDWEETGKAAAIEDYKCQYMQIPHNAINAFHILHLFHIIIIQV
jgi:hypothetical protein